MKVRIPLSTALTALLPLTGCFGTSDAQQHAVAQKRTFVPVAAPAASRPAATAPFAAVKIRPFRALPPFETCAFIVRRTSGEFASDYYNSWLVPPHDLIRVQTARYLAETRLFDNVFDAGSGTLPPLSLEGVVSELYLDFSGEKPAAVVTLRLLVLDEHAPAFTVLFSSEKSGRAEFDAHDKTAPAQAFGHALTQSLEALSQALAAATLPRVTTPGSPR